MTRTLDETLSRLAAITQLLDEHHVVVLGDEATDRADFALRLEEHLSVIPDVEVFIVRGQQMTSLDVLCRQIERWHGCERPINPTIDSLIQFLRDCPPQRKHQYILWRDADVLLEADVRLFGRIVNALIGTAAYHEHVDPDVLVLQRVVFFGGDKLGAYAEEPRGQFNAWRTDDDGDLWDVYACLDRPPVLTYRLDG